MSATSLIVVCCCVFRPVVVVIVVFFLGREPVCGGKGRQGLEGQDEHQGGHKQGRQEAHGENPSFDLAWRPKATTLFALTFAVACRAWDLSSRSFQEMPADASGSRSCFPGSTHVGYHNRVFECTAVEPEHTL